MTPLASTARTRSISDSWRSSASRSCSSVWMLTSRQFRIWMIARLWSVARDLPSWPIEAAADRFTFSSEELFPFLHPPRTHASLPSGAGLPPGGRAGLGPAQVHGRLVAQEGLQGVAQ